MPLPPDLVESRSDEREVFALINALKRQSTSISGGAPADANYWVSTPHVQLTSEVNMGALASGIIYQTVAAGISTPAIVTVGTGLSFVAPTLRLADTAVTPGSYTYSSITVDQQGRLTAAGSGTTPAPVDATYITQTPNATLSNEQALSALVTGVMQSTIATGVVSTFAVGTGLIPYGNGASLLATTSTFGFNAGNSTLAIGIAPASANANMRLHINGTVVGGVNALIQNQSAASAAFGSLVFLSDTGRGDVYFTSSTYGTGDSLPNSLTFGCTASVIFSPAYGRVLTLTGTDSIFEAGDLILDAGAQFIDKQGTGDLGIGTDGAQNLNLYTNDTDWVIISSAGEVGVTTGATQTWYNLGVPGSANSELVKAYWSSNTWNLENQVTGTGTLRPMVIDSNTAEMGLFGTGIMVLPGATFAFRNLGSIGATNYEQVRSFWSGNVWTLQSEEGGTGTVRSMRIDADTATLTLDGATVAITATTASTVASNITMSGVVTLLNGSTMALDNVDGTDYERVRGYWTGNIFRLDAEKGGTGTLRPIYVVAPTVLIGAATAGAEITVSATGGIWDQQPSVASGAGAVLNAIQFLTAATITGSTNITTADGFNAIRIYAPGYSGTVTVANAATVRLDGGPTISGGGAITNSYVQWSTGLARFDGNGTRVFELPADATANAASYIGRIPVLIAGTTRYLRYHSD